MVSYIVSMENKVTLISYGSDGTRKDPVLRILGVLCLGSYVCSGLVQDSRRNVCFDTEGRDELLAAKAMM